MSLAWLTPDTLPETTVCRVIEIPDDPFFIYAVNGALLNLTYSWHWEKYGSVEPEDAADRMFQLLTEYFESECGMNGGVAGLVGSVVTVLDEAAIPDNLLRLNGQLFQRVDYPELYQYFVDVSSPFIVDADSANMPEISNGNVNLVGFGSIPAYYCMVAK